MICVVLGVAFWDGLFYHELQCFYVCCFEPSGFCSVVSVTGYHVFPEASLYASFRGLDGDIMLQYCFHEFIFSFLISAWYFFFPSMYWFFLTSLSSSLCIVRWYPFLSAFIFILSNARASVHRETGFPLAVLFGEFKHLNFFFHVDCTVSLISSNAPVFLSF